jgi:hypothetical protein|tara:strand:- start:6372 stop:6647 length:276 start_codon:yes stop_codon:yes gene_type:complete
MARYPTLPMRLSNEDLMDMYKQIQRWGSILVNELDSRDLEAQNTPSTNIFRVVTITSIGRPKKGDIAYSASSGKFKGYVSLGSETSWQDLN